MANFLEDIQLLPSSFQGMASQLADQLRQAIIRGGLKPGEKLPSSAFIAKKLSLGAQTVQTAFNALVAEGLVVRRKRHGTFVVDIDQITSSPVSKSYQIAMIVFNLAIDSPVTPTLSLFLEGMQSVLRTQGCGLHLIAVDPKESTGSNNTIFRSTVTNKQIDGAVVRARMPEYFLKMLRDSEIPFVTQEWISYSNEPNVTDDPVNCACVAVEYFISNGHKRIGMVTADVTYDVRGEKRAGTLTWLGYCMAHSKHKLPLSPELVKEVSGYPKAKPENYARKTLELATGNHPPTAIYVANEKGALLALDMLKEKGIRVPEDVAIISRGGGRPRQFLATAEEDFVKIGKTQAKLILQTLEDGKYPDKRNYFFHSFVIPRGSCQRNGETVKVGRGAESNKKVGSAM